MSFGNYENFIPTYNNGICMYVAYRTGTDLFRGYKYYM